MTCAAASQAGPRPSHPSTCRRSSCCLSPGGPPALFHREPGLEVPPPPRRNWLSALPVRVACSRSLLPRWRPWLEPSLPRPLTRQLLTRGLASGAGRALARPVLALRSRISFFKALSPFPIPLTVCQASDMLPLRLKLAEPVQTTRLTALNGAVSALSLLPRFQPIPGKAPALSAR